MMCAFMTPVLKNDWEVYNTKRSRNNSESSQKSLPPSRSHANDLRRRVLSEKRSMSYHMGGQHGTESDFAFVKPPPRAYLSTRNSRNASRDSFSPVNSGCTSPTKNATKSNIHRRSSSSSSLNKFHSKVMDKLRNVLHLKDRDEDTEVPESSMDKGTKVKSST